MAAKKKMSFTKFQPEHGKFIVARAEAKASDDFFVDFSIYDGEKKIDLFLSEYSKGAQVNFLKDIIRGAQQVLDFYESITKLPKSPAGSDFGNLFKLKPTNLHPVKKPAAKKSSKK